MIEGIFKLLDTLFQVDENTQIHQNGPSQNHVENTAKPRHTNIQVRNFKHVKFFNNNILAIFACLCPS